MAKGGKLQDILTDLLSDDENEFSDSDEGDTRKANITAAGQQAEGGVPITISEQRFRRKRKIRHVCHYIKMVVFLVIWLICFIGITFTKEHFDDQIFVTVPPGGEFRQSLIKRGRTNCIELMLKGRFDFTAKTPVKQAYLNVYIERNGQKITNVWSLKLTESKKIDEIRESDWKWFNFEKAHTDELDIYFQNDDTAPLVMLVYLNSEVLDLRWKLMCGAIVLLVLYALIIADVVDRTFAAVLLCTLGIAILAFLKERPQFSRVIYWIDTETLLLIFGMMILVALLSETGVFDYIAVVMYKITRGKTWPLVITMSLFAGISASIMDSITMVMLLTPVIIRLCEVMALNTTPVLVMVVILANMGGSITSFGDPPNIIIIATKYVVEHNVNGLMFITHLGPCLIGCMLLALLQLRFQLGNKKMRRRESTPDDYLKRQIKTWRRAVEGITPYSAPEREMRDDMVKQVKSMQNVYRQQKAESKVDLKPQDKNLNFAETLQDLQKKFPIRNKVLLIKCGIAMSFAIPMFFLQSIPHLSGITSSWVAFLSVMLLLIITTKYEMAVILAHVDWAPLLFFASLFIIMESITQMGLVEWFGGHTIKIILSVSEEYRLGVTVVLLLWSTALISVIIDNVPTTTMMLKLAISLSKNTGLNLPLTPLLWALSLGTCLGGNGTLIGASSNIICAGLAEQHGYKFSFFEWFKIAFPVMLTTTMLATVYLYTTSVILKWY